VWTTPYLAAKNPSGHGEVRTGFFLDRASVGFSRGASLMYLNDWLSRRKLYTPDRVAVVSEGDSRSYTYAELEGAAARMARLLQQEFQICPGDRVACLSTNRLEYLALYFACGKIGALLVPLNFRFPTPQLRELLEDCRPQLLVYERAFGSAVDALAANGVASQFCSIEPRSGPGDSVCLANAWTGEAAERSDYRVYEASGDDIAMILYTSGTTGRAKGAMIPYRQILWNALNTTIGLQLTGDDVTFLNLPLFHTGGWHVLFTPLIQLGGRVVLQQKFDPHHCNELIGREGITILFGVPTMLRMLAEASNFDAADFSTVRCAIFGGEPCPVTVIETYQQRGVAMRQGYGLTEAGPNCFSLPAADAVRRQGSIGFPNFYVAPRLVGEGGREVAVGEVGELWMKGPHLFAGYWSNDAATREVLRDGWLATGDLMTRDADGYYYVVGRKKEMYVSGGENVYPAQVERVLQAHGAVALAAVLGVPHPTWGETGWAFIKPRPGCRIDATAVRDWCHQHLATFQCPTKFIVLDDLPLGPSGKIDKLQLAQRHNEWD
jgi:fatty-acyl-CoA synthase